MDTGTQLRALYEKDGGVANVFSGKVADYVSSRPDYPAELFEELTRACGLRTGSLVVDVGAGTGLLTFGLLVRGFSVVAVEPNSAMREAADRVLSTFAEYRSVDGSAERIPLQNSSADLVTAAHAFHWFAVQEARAECLRVLRPRGQVALIWNDRLGSDPFHKALDRVLNDYGGAKRVAVSTQEERGNLPAFFGQTKPNEYAWPHSHKITEGGLLGLVFSRSYMPARDSVEGTEVTLRLRELYRHFATDSGLVVRYTTVAFVGRPS